MSDTFTVSELGPFLKRFADEYAPTKHDKREKDLSQGVRNVLIRKRQLAEMCLAEKQILTSKVAEPQANSVDHTVRREREIASAAMSGEPWEVALVYKNSDLWRFLKAIKAKLQAIETVVRSPEPASYFQPYVPLYEERFCKLGVQFAGLLQAVYAGSCWKVLEDVRKRASEIYKEILTIHESDGVSVPDEAVRFARAKQAEAQAKAAESTPEVVEQAA